MKKKIIVVDDKLTIGKILAAYLSQEYDFEYYDNPLPCIERLKKGERPDLIISDIMMPNMKGDEFLAYIKSSQFSDIPVVILSGEDSSSQRIHLLQNGAEDYIVKPFNPLELKIRIGKILS